MRQKEADKYLEEHPELTEQDDRLYIERPETQIHELEKTMKEIKETVQNQKS
jgi:hypothetical protein